MTDDERDNPGIVVPPPLIYLGPLVLGLLLNRQLPNPFCRVGWRVSSDCRSLVAGRYSGGGSFGLCTMLVRRSVPINRCRG
jgi:hypothetical protein